MINQEVSIDIALPVPQVYDFVVTSYIQNHPRWDPRVVQPDAVSEGPPPAAGDAFALSELDSNGGAGALRRRHFGIGA